MTRLLGMLVVMTLLVPLALAAPEGTIPSKDTQPSLPDLAPVATTLAHAASSAASAAGSAAASLGHAFAAAAAALGMAFAALGAALSAAASAIGAGLLALTLATGRAVGALTGALTSLGAFLGAALGSGARYVAAHPKESAIVAGSATGISLLGIAIKKWWLSLFVPLYSRLARSDILENHVRASVFEHVKAHPGIHPSAIAEAIGIGWGTTVYHLARLEESSLVSTRAARGRKCYFAVGGELTNEDRTAVAAMSTDKGRAIVDALRIQPGMSQKALAETLGMSQALASWHVKRLVQSGILVTVRDGRSNLLSVAEHVPVVAPSAAMTPLAA